MSEDRPPDRVGWMVADPGALVGLIIKLVVAAIVALGTMAFNRQSLQHGTAE